MNGQRSQNINYKEPRLYGERKQKSRNTENKDLKFQKLRHKKNENKHRQEVITTDIMKNHKKSQRMIVSVYLLLQKTAVEMNDKSHASKTIMLRSYVVKTQPLTVFA